MEAQPPEVSSAATSFSRLRALEVLGQGAMGTVFLVYDKESDPRGESPFALKVVDKSAMHDKFEAERRARWEVQVLSRTTSNPHPFLPCLLSKYSFEVPGYVSWALPFCPGGDLNALRYRQCDHVFSPAVARFYLAEILTAIEHLHELGIVYRDLKPENVLIQSSGHVTLTDFDLSRSLSKPATKVFYAAISSPVRERRRVLLKRTKSSRVSPVRPGVGERSCSFVGTEEYVAPEVVSGEGHEFAVDWWAFGVLAYEMIYGTTPFKGRNRKETFWNVVNKQPSFVGKRSDLTDLIERLLQKDPTRRLGYLRGAREIKNHPFFRPVRWNLLTSVLRPPYIPPAEAEYCKEGFDVAGFFQKTRNPREESSFSQREASFSNF